MQIKKYQAINMKEALKMVKRDLGSDAVILSSRTIEPEKNEFGLMEKSLMEVVAAVDRDFKRDPIQKVFKKDINFDNQPYKNAKKLTEKSHISYEKLASDKEFLNSAVSTLQKDVKAIVQSTSFSVTEEIKSLKSELNEIKWLLKGVLGNSTIEDPNTISTENKPFPRAFKALILNGINQQFAMELVELARENTPDLYCDNEEVVLENIRKEIKKLIQIDYDEPSQRTKVIALVGPTGVGKTTTLAKIVAKKVIEDKKNVGIITLDTFRIGAVEQLKTYAQIINVPLKVAKSPEELKKAINLFKDKDVIMIDTIGHSPKNMKQLKKLQEALQFNPIVENHLVLSCSAKEEDILDTINKFDLLNIDSLIFTKTDETTSYGSILNVLIKAGKPLSYITNGQNVPEDILKATKENVAEMVFQ